MACGIAVAISIVPFIWATTFFTDDHLLLAFARYAPNPLLAFIRDQHGGEFYRPLTMTLWWLMARIGGGTIWPFALVGLALHLAVAAQVALLILTLGGPRRVAWTAGAFFFLSPETREAALWFAAFPDLLATAVVLGSLIALLRGRQALSTGLGVIAYLSKESAIVLPALGLLVLAVRDRGEVPAPWRRRVVAIVPHGLLALAYLAARWRVLGGWGGTGDERAPFVGKLLQIASGLVHSIAGVDIFPEAFAWGAGFAFLAVAIFLAAGRTHGDGHGDGGRLLLPLIFVGIAILPLFAAPWIIGARYFYLPTVGLAWLAGEAFGGAAPPARIAGALFLLTLGGIQTLARHSDVVAYDRRVDAARRAVADGVAHGYRVFHIAGGIKDLDLAVKESPALQTGDPVADQFLVLGDVPASFVAIPDALAGAAAFLVAVPPLPPSGAYQFGARRVVGLARRGDEPTLDELVARFPEVRFIRLRPTPGGRVVARDVTEEIRRTLD